MKNIPVRELSAGSYFDSALYLDDNYILLAPDIPLNDSLIRRLSMWDLSEVKTSGAVTDAPPTNGEASATAASGTLSADIRDEENRREAIEAYKKAIVQVDGIMERFKTMDVLRIAEVTELVKELISLVKTHPRYALNLPDIETPDKGFIVSHAVKTSILAVALADFLKLPPHRMIEVGNAGVLHNIGMLRIPSSLYLSDRPLTARERQTIIAVPVLGFRSLKSAEFPIPVCLAVLEHHERSDGSGYPRGLNGEKISLYGKILAVASSYVAAVSSRPFREPLDGHSGIMDLLRDMGKLYDERVLRALVFTLSIYPIGTYIELRNGSRGVVVKTNVETPKLPIVRLLCNGEHEPYLERPLVQTEESGELSVVRPLNAEEIRRLRLSL